MKGNGRRAVWDDSGNFVINGVEGDINLTYAQQLAGFIFPQLHLIECGVTGDINYAVSAGAVSGFQTFLDDATIGGQIINASGSACSVWARGRNAEAAGDIEGIGGASGKVDYLIIENAVISNDVTITGTLPCQWTHVRLLNSATFDFSGATSAVAMDKESYKEYLASTTTAQRFQNRVSMLDGGNSYVVTEDGPFVAVQDAIDDAEFYNDGQKILDIYGNFTEDLTLTKPGIHLNWVAGLGDRFSGGDTPALTGSITYNLTATAQEICNVIGVSVSGVIHITGSEPTLVYLDKVAARLTGNNSNGTSRFICSRCKIVGGGGFAAVTLTGATAIDCNNGDNEFSGVDGSGVCIDINAGGDGFVGIDCRIGGQAKIAGAAGFTLTGSSSNIINAGGAAVDRSGGTGGAVVLLVGVQIFASGDIVLNPGGDPAKFTYSGLTIYGGTLDDTVGTAARNPVAGSSVMNLTHTETGASYTAGTNGETVVLADATAASQTIDLPTGTNGLTIIVKKIDGTANTVTIDPAGAATLDGAATAVLSIQYTSLTLVSDASGNWHVV